MATSRFGSNLQAPSFIGTDSAKRMGEVEVNFEPIVQLGDGAAPLSSAEMNGSGVAGFYQITSGDEVDTIFRVPADYDDTKDAYLDCVYTLASSTATAADTVHLIAGYQIPTMNGGVAGTRLADATVVTGVTNFAKRVLGAGIGTGGVGCLFKDTATITSAATISAGDFVHAVVEAKTTCANDVELRLYHKAIFRYARSYV